MIFLDSFFKLFILYITLTFNTIPVPDACNTHLPNFIAYSKKKKMSEKQITLRNNEDFACFQGQ